MLLGKRKGNLLAAGAFIASLGVVSVLNNDAPETSTALVEVNKFELDPAVPAWESW